MMNQKLARFLGILLIVLSGVRMTAAAEISLAALDLVTADAAFCLEIPRLEETWSMLESGELGRRLRAQPASQRFLQSPAFRQWQQLEDFVTKTSREKLLTQIRALFAKSLVVAIYVPSNGVPQGILIGEAVDAAAVKTAFATWSSLDPNVTLTKRTHRSHRYYQRKRQSDGGELFLASSERWFAITDHESLIHQVIDRFVAVTDNENPKPTLADSLRQSNLFVRNRERLSKDCSAYVHIRARPWDRSVEEASGDTKQAIIDPAAIWKHVNAVSACLQLDQGLVCDSVVELDTTNLPPRWSQFVMSAAGEPGWNDRIPAEALLAFGGHLELAPFVKLATKSIQSAGLVELSKYRRMAQAFFGGQDLLDTVLPLLAKNFRGYIVPRTDLRTKSVALDGMLGFTIDSSVDGQLVQDVDRGLESGLNLLAAYYSGESRDVVIVNREQAAATRFRWLSETAPFPLALGMKDKQLVIAGSHDRLRQALGPVTENKGQTRLTNHSRRYFPNANQFVWLDTVLIRQLLKNNGAEIARLCSRGSADEFKRMLNRFELFEPPLELIDSLFAAGRVESDHVRITFGGGLDEK